jgi:probable phosphoglycerate mutase
MGLPQIVLVRHGETAWSLSGQHTGRTDIPLTANGEQAARQLRARLGTGPLAGRTFAKVLTSPLLRARQTCDLAGFGSIAEAEPDLMEWNYGEYEGKTTAEIRAARPGWNPFDHGCPGGESLADISARAERLVTKLRAFGLQAPGAATSGGSSASGAARESGAPGASADVLLFAHRDILRVLAACWAQLAPGDARRLYMEPTSISILGYDHGPDEPLIRSLNT